MSLNNTNSARSYSFHYVGDRIVTDDIVKAEEFNNAFLQFATIDTSNASLPDIGPLRGDKVSMLTHIYPHKPWRNIEVTICKITRLTAHFMCGLMSDLLICTCL